MLIVMSSTLSISKKIFEKRKKGLYKIENKYYY